MIYDVHDLNFIKKSFIIYEGKTERILIYRKAGESSFHYEFTCPKCGYKTDYLGMLESKKIKEGGKNKEYYIVKCQKCGTDFRVEKLKPGKKHG